MNNSNILQEAFKQLELIEEEAEFPLDAKGAEEAKDYMSDSEALDALEVIDTEAETEEDLEESHIGDVILECSVCHSQTFMDPEEVDISEESDLANEGTECPYCYCTNGFKVIGQVAPYEEPPTIEIEHKDDFEDEENIEDEDVFEESFKKDFRKYKKLKESIGDELTHTLDLAFNKHHPVLVTTEPGLGTFARVKQWVKQHTNNPVYIDAKSIEASDIGGVVDYNEKTYRLSNDEPIMKMKDASQQDIFILDGINRVDPSIRSALLDVINRCKGFVISIVVNNSYNTDELDPAERSKFVEVNVDESSSITESLENIDIETEHDIIHVNSEDKIDSDEEMLAPLDPEVKEEIEEPEEEISDEEFDEEEVPEEEYEDVDVDNFDEETFDNMGESYLRKVYDNVKSFKTSSVRENGNKWIVEGKIGFKSGKKKNTQFVFEALTKSNSGTLTFTGYNKQISRGNKSFTLKGSIDKNKFFTESLRYNYRQKDSDGKSVRVYGTVKRK